MGFSNEDRFEDKPIREKVTRTTMATSYHLFFGGFFHRFSAFWLGRLAFVPDGRSKPRADSGPNRPPASAGQPSGGRAAFQTPCIALDPTV